MTCRQLIEFLAHYLDGDLPNEQRRAFDEHLGDCSECRRYLDQYKSSIDLSRLLAERDDTLPKLPSELVKAVLEACKR
jgi:predicted anti-sigma-YlaC factor YlaD